MKKLLVPVAALVVGAVLGYALKPVEKAPASASAPARRGKTAIADAGDADLVKALRKRIAALEAELAAARKTSEKTPAAANEGAVVRDPDASRGPGRGPDGFREHLKKLEKEDPAKYAQITNRFAKMRRMRLDRTLGRLEFLASVDVSALGADAAKVHDGLQKAIEMRETLEEKMHDENLTDAERRSLMEQMREADGTMRRLASTERTNLLKLTAESIGLSGDDAQALVETVASVVDATESRGGPPPGPPPEMGPPPSAPAP